MGEILLQTKKGGAWFWKGIFALAVIWVVVTAFNKDFLSLVIAVLAVLLIYPVTKPITYIITSNSLIFRKGQDTTEISFEQVKEVRRYGNADIKIPVVHYSSKVKPYIIIINEEPIRGISFQPTKDFLAKLKEVIPEKVVI
ncbi:MAG: hypothetical protein ACYDG6_11040 [Thermincolia bacterium]